MIVVEERGPKFVRTVEVARIKYAISDISIYSKSSLQYLFSSSTTVLYIFIFFSKLPT